MLGGRRNWRVRHYRLYRQGCEDSGICKMVVIRFTGYDPANDWSGYGSGYGSGDGSGDGYG